MRAARWALGELWRSLPDGRWRKEDDATWRGLCVGLERKAAERLEQKLRQRALDRRAKGVGIHAVVAEVYTRAAEVLREGFGLDEAEQARRWPTQLAGRPGRLDWSGWTCRPGFLIWDTRQRLSRELFIERIERG